MPDTFESQGSAPEHGADLQGRYRLIERLGRGGQGTVFLAEDLRLRRRVAVKILEGGLGGLPATGLARLKREAEALSRLDHPRLCAVYDADLDGEQPYFAMRYVPGETLALRIELARSEGRAGGEGRLLGRLPRTRREIDAVVLFIEQAARAVHVAHEAGIIHRDLKPGNIMIDPQSEPVVLDFGLARDLGSNGASITVSGDAFGTLSYMSPEQLSGGHELDRRADVYSLAVTLYECLTFRRPVEAATREALLKGILAGVQENPADVNPALPRDLATVLSCALDLDRGRRYATALAFAEDLRRVREKEPILARRAGWWVLTRRWAHRHPALFAGGLATFTLLLAGLAVTVALLARVTKEQEQTRREQSRLDALRRAYLAQVLANEKPALALRLGIEAARREQHPEIDNILYDLLDRCYERQTFAIGLGASWVSLGFQPVIDANGRLLVGYAGGIAGFDLSSGERRDLLSGEAAGKGPAGAPPLALSADGKRLVSSHFDGSLRFWDLGASPTLREERPSGRTGPEWIELSPDEKRVAAAYQDGAVTIHETATAGAPITFALDDRSLTVARWHPSGAFVAVCGLLRPAQPDARPSAAVFDARTGERVAVLGPAGVSATWAAWSHDGTRLAVAFASTLKVFRTSDWSLEADLVHGDMVRWAAFHSDDRRLVTGSTEGVGVYDVAGARRIAVVGGFRDRSVIRGAFSPDGSRLAVVSWDQTASIISCDTWTEERKLKGLGRPRGACWSADGKILATTDEATFARTWYPSARPHLPVLSGHGGRVVGAAFAADGATVVTGARDGNARSFDAKTGALRHVMSHGGTLSAARVGPGGRVLTVGGGTLVAWDAADGRRVRDLARDGVRAVDGWLIADDRVFATYEDGTARLWRAATGEVLATFPGHQGPVICAAFHEGRRWVATAGSDLTVRVSDLETGTSIATLSYKSPGPLPAGTNPTRVFALAFDADGGRIVAGCEDVAVRVWDVQSARLERVEKFATPGMLAMSPAGRWMAVGAAWLGRIGFLDLADPGVPLKAAPFHDSHMNSAIRFSSDGAYFLAAAKDGMVRIWTMDPVRARSAFDARCGILVDASFSPDGTRVLAAGAEGTARIWPLDSLRAAEQACPVSDEVWEAMQVTLEQALFGK